MISNDSAWHRVFPKGLLVVLSALVIIQLFTTAPAFAAGTSISASQGSPAPQAAAGISGLNPNLIWLLVTAFLVMFMQAGFALVETGLCRAKNVAHMVSMNLMIYPLSCLAFWVYGFAIGWGNWSNGAFAPGWSSNVGPGVSMLNSGLGLGGGKYGLMGLTGFCLGGVDDVGVLALFFFMMVFLNTAAAIPIGAVAERWNWKNLCLYGLWVALPYGLFANWVWGGGWLAQAGKNWGLGHGAVDFAGSGVVHVMGGVIGLVGVLVVGPRIGKYVNRKPRAMPGHHLPMVVVGTFILAFGWFGFNSGWTVVGADLRLPVVAVNTVLAGAAGAVSAMLCMTSKKMKPDPSLMCNGLLAGLVAIAAPCAFVSSWAAVIIGAVAGVLVVVSVLFWDSHGVDDPVGVISVHGISGLWGVLAVGVFANGKYGAGWNGVSRGAFVTQFGSDGVRGILYGDPSQLLAQVVNCAVLVVFGFVMAYTWFRISDAIAAMRVSREAELQGLDNPQMGALGYPDFTLASHGGSMFGGSSWGSYSKQEANGKSR